jgi:hypothetical protein
MGTNNKRSRTKREPGRESAEPGVWNRNTGSGPANPIRVRTRRLDQIDGDKIALAYWLLAQRIVENRSDRPVGEDEAREVAAKLGDARSSKRPRRGGPQ